MFILLKTVSKIPILYRPFSTASNKSKVVFITGCDSGLGFSLAQKVLGEGALVVAGCLQTQSAGACLLKDLGAHVVRLDVTSRPSVLEAVKNVQTILTNQKYQLHGVVNNAAVMVFGEFEWQTPKQITHQIDVNLVGPFNIAHSFLPLLRKDQGRLVNIVSHCALAGLPGLTIYGASKAALLNWSDALRVEQAKYGVQVISFVPGSFYGLSNIMAQQDEYAREMLSNMSTISREFHETYFIKVQDYLKHLPRPNKPQSIEDQKLNSKLLHAIFAENPNAHYVHQPMRYAIYHLLFKISPVRVRDYFINRFVSLPKY